MQVIREITPVTIRIETEEELKQLRGMLNFSPIITSIPIAKGIQSVVGCEENDYWRKLRDNAAEINEKKEG